MEFRDSKRVNKRVQYKSKVHINGRNVGNVDTEHNKAYEKGKIFKSPLYSHPV